jgi:hypothetical protein
VTNYALQTGHAPDKKENKQMSAEEDVTIKLDTRNVFPASHKIIEALQPLSDIEQGLAVATAVTCMFQGASEEFLNLIIQMIPQVRAQIKTSQEKADGEG